MKVLNTILLILLAGTGIHGKAQVAKAARAVIADWYHDMPGAVSVTFDDACYTQYTAAIPVLDMYNIKATFSVVGEWVHNDTSFSKEEGSFMIRRMGWKQLLDLYKEGHELAAHGYVHEKYDPSLPVVKLAQNMARIKKLIEAKTAAPVFTMNYPYSFATGSIPPAAEKAGFLFGRTGLDTVNDADPACMFLLSSRAILGNQMPDSATYRKWIAQAKGKWLILMYHHLFDSNSSEMEIIRQYNTACSYSVNPEIFEWQMKEAMRPGYWIAPVEAVGKYIMERENTVIRLKVRRNKIKVRTVINIDHKHFNQPLTLAVQVPWPVVNIMGSLDDGIREAREGRVLIDFLPGASIRISRKSN